MHHESFSKEKYIGDLRHISAERKEVIGVSNAHIHDFFELELILDGKGEQILNGKKYDLSRGCIYLLTPADFHTVTASSSLSLVNIMFDEQAVDAEMLATLFADGRGLFLTLGDEDTDVISTAASLLIRETVGAKNDGRQAPALLEYILSYLLRIAKHTASQERGASNDGFSKAMLYIYTNFKDSPPLSKIASACGYSENYFSTVFKQRMGFGYSDFLNMMKVRYAKFLLLSTQSSTAEIAASCGFSSLSNFYRVFKAFSGVSTTEYRRSLRHERKN